MKAQPSMQFVLLLRANEAAFARMTEVELRAALEAFTRYAMGLEAQGVLTGSGELKPSSTATTLTWAVSSAVMHDRPGEIGPAQLTGFYVVEVQSLDHALALAKDCPILSAGGSVEVRPLVQGVTPAHRARVSKTRQATSQNLHTQRR
jgi:hypothetical protein